MLAIFTAIEYLSNMYFKCKKYEFGTKYTLRKRSLVFLGFVCIVKMYKNTPAFFSHCAHFPHSLQSSCVVSDTLTTEIASYARYFLLALFFISWTLSERFDFYMELTIQFQKQTYNSSWKKQFFLLEFRNLWIAARISKPKNNSGLNYVLNCIYLEWDLKLQLRCKIDTLIM